MLMVSQAWATKPVPPRQGDCEHYKSQYIQYWKAYEQETGKANRTFSAEKRRQYQANAQYYRQQSGRYRALYEEKCQVRPVAPPVRNDPRPGSQNDWASSGQKCFSEQGRNGWCTRNNCEPNECYWIEPITGVKHYGLGRMPLSGWKK